MSVGRAVAVPASRDHNNFTKHKRQGLVPEQISFSGEGKGVQDVLRRVEEEEDDS